MCFEVETKYRGWIVQRGGSAFVSKRLRIQEFDGIWRVADEAVWNNVQKKNKSIKIPY